MQIIHIRVLEDLPNLVRIKRRREMKLGKADSRSGCLREINED